jgi:hypothetical protein
MDCDRIEVCSFKRNLIDTYFPKALSNIICEYGSTIEFTTGGIIEDFTNDEHEFCSVMFFRSFNVNRLIFTSQFPLKVSFSFDETKHMVEMVWNDIRTTNLTVTFKLDCIKDNISLDHLNNFESVLQTIYNYTIFHDLSLKGIALIQRYTQTKRTGNCLNKKQNFIDSSLIKHLFH